MRLLVIKTVSGVRVSHNVEIKKGVFCTCFLPSLMYCITAALLSAGVIAASSRPSAPHKLDSSQGLCISSSSSMPACSRCQHVPEEQDNTTRAHSWSELLRELERCDQRSCMMRLDEQLRKPSAQQSARVYLHIEDDSVCACCKRVKLSVNAVEQGCTAEASLGTRYSLWAYHGAVSALYSALTGVVYARNMHLNRGFALPSYTKQHRATVTQNIVLLGKLFLINFTMTKRAVAACLFACPVHCFVVPALQRNTACRTAQCAMSACGDAQTAKLGQSVSSVAAALLIGSSILTSSSLPAQAFSSFPASTVYVSEADQIGTVLAELAAADSSESILQAMVRINEISESDDGTLEDPMTREVSEHYGHYSMLNTATTTASMTLSSDLNSGIDSCHGICFATVQY
jgi:hypothetical protein